MEHTTGPVQSIDRVLDIVELLAAAPQGLALSELGAAAGLHVSTAYRLLNALSNRGYVRKDAISGKYRLTLRLFEVGSRVSGAIDLLSAAKPMLDGLSDFTQEAVHLAKRDGSDMVYLYKAEPFRQLVRMESHVGHRAPMYCTGVGKSILSLLPAEEVKAVWDSSQICAFTEKTITDWVVFQKELDETRSRGYALDDEEHEPGVRCIAVAIRDWAGSPFAAVSISAPVFRMTNEAIETALPRMNHLAEEVSRLFGKA